MAGFSTNDIDEVNLGEDPVQALYLGDQLVWAGSITGMDILFVPDEFEEG